MAIVTTALILHARHRRRWAAWRGSTRPVVDAALVSRDLLPAHGRDITDMTQWESVRSGAERAAADLAAAGAAAPGDEAGLAARQSAEALSALVFGLESARLMQSAQPPPTADGLADADAVVQARRLDLDGALARLDLVVGPPPPAAATATPPATPPSGSPAA